MNERKGLFYKEQENFIADLAADSFELKNPIANSLKKPAFRLMVSIIDDNLIEKVPQEWQNPIEPVIDEAMAGNWVNAAEKAATFINKKVDIPGIDEVSEYAIFNGVLQLAAGIIINRAKSLN